MGDPFNKVVKDFAKSLQAIAPDKTSPYDTQAEVRRTEGNTAWVHIPGGVDETPVQLTTNAKKGDIVQVRVSGGQAWITGNATNPPTDDTTAKAAQKTAAVADEHATDAVASALLAQQFAEEAQESASIARVVTNEIQQYAQTAEKSVTEILADAETAKINADVAQKSADRAVESLITIEDVVGVVNWISQHGRYIKTLDSEYIEGKYYYSVSASVVSYPRDKDIDFYYELDNGTYILTTDTSIQGGKTYYTLTAVMQTDTSKVPVDQGWYELESVDEAVQAYLSNHLAMMEEGLVLMADNNNYKTLITDGYYRLTSDTVINTEKDYYVISDGQYVKVQNPDDQDISTYYELIYRPGVHIFYGGNELAYYGEDVIVGDVTSFNMLLTSTELDFRNATEVIAYMSGQELYIPRAVVVNGLQIGNWRWDAESQTDHITLRWIGA